MRNSIQSARASGAPAGSVKRQWKPPALGPSTLSPVEQALGPLKAGRTPGWRLLSANRTAKIWLARLSMLKLKTPSS